MPTTKLNLPVVLVLAGASLATACGMAKFTEGGSGSKTNASGNLTGQGEADTAKVGARLEKAPGWSLSCGGHLCSSVGGGGAGSDTPKDGDKGASGVLGLRDNCTNADLKALTAKGIQYVLVTFDA